jgi:molecular chaperone IbpA
MTTDVINLDRFLSQALGLTNLATQVHRSSRPSSNFPPYNLSVDDAKNPSRYTLELAVAGFTKDELLVKVRYQGDVSLLVVSGEKKQSEKSAYIHQGLTAGTFYREFTMQSNCYVDRTELKDGILTIVVNVTLPRDPEEKTYKIM